MFSVKDLGTVRLPEDHPKGPQGRPKRWPRKLPGQQVFGAVGGLPHLVTQRPKKLACEAGLTQSPLPRKIIHEADFEVPAHRVEASQIWSRHFKVKLDF